MCRSFVQKCKLKGLSEIYQHVMRKVHEAGVPFVIKRLTIKTTRLAQKCIGLYVQYVHKGAFTYDVRRFGGKGDTRLPLPPIYTKIEK